MKKKFFISALAVLVFLICTPLFLKAQTIYEDVVYLKNGSIIHGMIIEQVPNVSLKIQTADRNVFVFKIEEIEKITKEPVPEKTATASSSKGIDHIKEKGFTNITELNFYRYDIIEKEVRMATGLNTSFGYLFNPYISLGGGTGFEIIDEAFYLPFYADIRVNMLKKPVTPFLAAKFGYAFAFANNYNDYRGGIMLNANLGIKFFVSPQVAMFFGLGYRFQQYQYRYDVYPMYYPGYPYYSTLEKGTHNLLTLSFGVTI